MIASLQRLSPVEMIRRLRSMPYLPGPNTPYNAGSSMLPSLLRSVGRQTFRRVISERSVKVGARQSSSQRVLEMLRKYASKKTPHTSTRHSRPLAAGVSDWSHSQDYTCHAEDPVPASDIT